jgi:hypothetical protein
MGSITWGPEVAGVYDKTYSAMFEPSVLDPMVSLLAELAQGGPALEFAVGTGRVALALSARGPRYAALSCRGTWRSGCSPSLAPTPSR